MGVALARVLHAAARELTSHGGTQPAARLVAISSRRTDAARELAEQLPGVAAVSTSAMSAHVDLVLLCVGDADIASAAADAAWMRGLTLVHTSGAQDLSVLASAAARGARIGSFHPMVSVTRRAGANATERFRGAVAAVDGDEHVRSQLCALAETIGLATLHVPGEWRGTWHAAAAMVGNTGAALVAHAEHMLRELPGGVAIRRKALAGLLASVAHSLAGLPEEMEAGDAISGPIARGDTGTVQLHLRGLRARPDGVWPRGVGPNGLGGDVAVNRDELERQRRDIDAYARAAELIMLAMGERLSADARRTITDLISLPHET